MYPLTTNLVEHIHQSHLIKRVELLARELQKAPSEAALIELLKKQEALLFFRVTLYNPIKGYFFDSKQEIDSPDFEEESQNTPAEITEALKDGYAYAVRYSLLFSEQMVYVALKFNFQENPYILRAGFPNGQIVALTHDLTGTFLIFVIGLLLLFSLFAWFIFHHLTKPVYAILNSIRPFQEGREEQIPEIIIDNQVSEFGQLASTLNALSNRVQYQIETLTHEKNEKSAILESLVEGVVAVDTSLVVIYMNRMAEIFLDVDQQNVVGKPFSKIGQPHCEELLKRAQIANEPVFSVMKLGRKARRFFDLVAVPSGAEGGAILVLQDKTSLHRVIEMGRDFVANASHELKTPITIISGFAETLHDHPELSAEISHEITQKILSNCVRMETLIRNLLTLATLDEGLPDSRLMQGDLIDIVEQAKQMTRSIHPHAHIAIEEIGDSPFTLRMDSALFLQAIFNLLDNAAKYSKPPADILVRVIKTEEAYLIHVIDHGIGIPEADLDRIFERFYAVDKSHSRMLGGSGLGLSIVEQIIEKHKGKIEVQSEVGEGTTFVISLPRV
ncbi:MAG: PAS domain-containing protein [Verrucomicrobia bacterium]|nr:PAS domain-containing protein [Verrucomicrobiota bacterium]